MTKNDAGDEAERAGTAYTAKQQEWVRDLARWVMETAHQEPVEHGEPLSSTLDVANSRVERLTLRETHDLLRFAHPESVSTAMDNLDPFFDDAEDLEDLDGLSLIRIIAGHVLDNEATRYYDDPLVRPDATPSSSAAGTPTKSKPATTQSKRRKP